MAKQTYVVALTAQATWQHKVRASSPAEALEIAFERPTKPSLTFGDAEESFTLDADGVVADTEDFGDAFDD